MNPFDFRILLCGEGSSDIQSDTGSGSLLPVFLYFFRDQVLSSNNIPVWVREAHPWDSDFIKSQCRTVPKKDLQEISKSLQPFRPGRTQENRELLDFSNKARTLAIYAQRHGAELATFFHDCDKHAASDVEKSIKRGFDFVEFKGGILMLPKPTSEAWILTAWINYVSKDKKERISKSNAKQFEEEFLRHNDRNENSAKAQLAKRYTGKKSVMALDPQSYKACISELDQAGAWDSIRVLPSVEIFLESITKALESVCSEK